MSKNKSENIEQNEHHKYQKLRISTDCNDSYQNTIDYHADDSKHTPNKQNSVSKNKEQSHQRHKTNEKDNGTSGNESIPNVMVIRDQSQD